MNTFTKYTVSKSVFCKNILLLFFLIAKRNISASSEYLKNGYKGADKSFFMVIKEGVALGICIDRNKLLFKTFIDFDSLNKSKKEESDYLGDNFNEYDFIIQEIRYIMINNPLAAMALSAAIKIRNSL